MNDPHTRTPYASGVRLYHLTKSILFPWLPMRGAGGGERRAGIADPPWQRRKKKNLGLAPWRPGPLPLPSPPPLYLHPPPPICITPRAPPHSTHRAEVRCRSIVVRTLYVVCTASLFIALWVRAPSPTQLSPSSTS